MILEILISTMNRTDLSFLRKLFVHNDISDYQILIINQTNADSLLVSDSKRIRVINSFEIGISKSRNLAIKNGIGDICLIADDDVEYVKGFDDIIKEAYASFKDSDCIVFNSNINGKTRNPKYLNYSKKIKSIKECVNVCSVEISFKREFIQSRNIKFNEFLGLNSPFPSGEELVFLNDVFKHFNIFFKNKIILNHQSISSGTKLSLMEITPILAVQYYLVFPNKFYFKIVKLIVFFIINRRLDLLSSITVFNKCIDARRLYIELTNK
jgi:hypothetical protein